MKLKVLRKLPELDQQTFLVGRIASEAVRLDAALRGLNAGLRGEKKPLAFLDAPDYFSANLTACRKLLDKHPGVSAEVRVAIVNALDSAALLYMRRNRFIHDLLRHDVLEENWELARMHRVEDDAVAFETVSFDEMVALVCDLIGTSWRLRAGGRFLLDQGSTWEDLLMGTVTGQWDGNASWIG